jgi:hypothetical protein
MCQDCMKQKIKKNQYHHNLPKIVSYDWSPKPYITTNQFIYLKMWFMMTTPDKFAFILHQNTHITFSSRFVLDMSST